MEAAGSTVTVKVDSLTAATAVTVPLRTVKSSATGAAATSTALPLSSTNASVKVMSPSSMDAVAASAVRFARSRLSPWDEVTMMDATAGTAWTFPAASMAATLSVWAPIGMSSSVSSAVAGSTTTGAASSSVHWNLSTVPPMAVMVNVLVVVVSVEAAGSIPTAITSKAKVVEFASSNGISSVATHAWMVWEPVSRPESSMPVAMSASAESAPPSRL